MKSLSSVHNKENDESNFALSLSFARTFSLSFARTFSLSFSPSLSLSPSLLLFLSLLLSLFLSPSLRIPIGVKLQNEVSATDRIKEVLHSTFFFLPSGNSRCLSLPLLFLLLFFFSFLFNLFCNVAHSPSSSSSSSLSLFPRPLPSLSLSPAALRWARHPSLWTRCSRTYALSWLTSSTGVLREQRESRYLLSLCPFPSVYVFLSLTFLSLTFLSLSPSTCVVRT